MGESTKVNKAKKENKENGGSNSNKLIVILLVITIVVVVGLAAFFGYMMLSKKPSGSNNQAATTVTRDAVKTVDLDEFIVNLAGGGNSYVKITISLGYVSSDVENEIKDSKSIVRDAINKTIMGKKASDFKETGGLDKIQNQLKASINSVLTKGQITNVYFSNIVIQ